MAKIIELIKCTVTALIICAFIGIICCLCNVGEVAGHNHEQYTEIVDKYITHNDRYGNPRYWVVYKFVDGCIEEMAVSSTEYYTVGED